MFKYSHSIDAINFKAIITFDSHSSMLFGYLYKFKIQMFSTLSKTAQSKVPFHNGSSSTP